jgi:hypothetical protein
VDDLTAYITERLEKRSYCTVFENKLTAFPKSWRQAKRFAAIQKFAADRGWSATIHDPGIRVVFRKLGSAVASEKSVMRLPGK